MSAAQPIEDALTALCAAHDLTSISVQVGVDRSPGYECQCFVHWTSATGNNAALGYGVNTSAAIREAISKANEARIHAPVVSSLTMAEAA